MSQLFVSLFGALLVLATVHVDAEKKEIHLPADCDVVTIVGNGFKLELNQFDQIKQEWNQVATESAKVESPRGNDGSEVVVNTGLYETSKNAPNQLDRGIVDDALLQWIVSRATSLADRIERYQAESYQGNVANQIVVKILLLNTLVDLENLTKENIRSLKWIKNKLKHIGHRSVYQQDVLAWVNSKIKENEAIEDNTRGKNNPGDKWMANTKALKRVLQEQRFSVQVGSNVLEFLDGRFSMMQRSRVFDVARPNKPIEDILYYKPAKNLVPPHFPFFAQDAIVN